MLLISLYPVDMYVSSCVVETVFHIQINFIPVLLFLLICVLGFPAFQYAKTGQNTPMPPSYI